MTATRSLYIPCGTRNKSNDWTNFLFATFSGHSAHHQPQRRPRLLPQHRHYALIGVRDQLGRLSYTAKIVDHICNRRQVLKGLRSPATQKQGWQIEPARLEWQGPAWDAQAGMERRRARSVGLELRGRALLLRGRSSSSSRGRQSAVDGLGGGGTWLDVRRDQRPELGDKSKQEIRAKFPMNFFILLILSVILSRHFHSERGPRRGYCVSNFSGNIKSWVSMLVINFFVGNR